MEESSSTDQDNLGPVKTSSTDSKDNPKTTGDSQVQDGEGVSTNEEPVKGYDKSDDQQEYVEQANNNTKVSNASPVENGKGLTM